MMKKQPGKMKKQQGKGSSSGPYSDKALQNPVYT